MSGRSWASAIALTDAFNFVLMPSTYAPKSLRSTPNDASRLNRPSVYDRAR